MAQGRGEDKRFFPRYVMVSKDFPGKLEKDDKILDSTVVDVSRDGMGVLVSQELKVNDMTYLLLGDKKIQFQVIYCHPDIIHKGKHRCGLKRVGIAENLVSLFRASGYLESP